jgi:hypothetical protein
MNDHLFEQLLWQAESETLDFKQQQYPFAKATEEQKSELVKDIVVFANAWKQSESYILIGVEEVKGGRGIIHGVTEQLDDHSLQQFMNFLTVPPVKFRYEAFTYETRGIGILTIPKQKRPVVLKRDLGGLKRGVVYVRRGSAMVEASAEEIARMGEANVLEAKEEPQLEVQLADVVRKQPLRLSLALYRSPRMRPGDGALREPVSLWSGSSSTIRQRLLQSKSSKRLIPCAWRTFMRSSAITWITRKRSMSTTASGKLGRTKLSR